MKIWYRKKQLVLRAFEIFVTRIEKLTYPRHNLISKTYK